VGQAAVDGKSNEITALPDLLGRLDLRGRDVTMDALIPSVTAPSCCTKPERAASWP